MNTILTLNIDENVVEKAEIYAKNSKKTISQLIEEYLLSISLKKRIDNNKLEPITSQLAGIIELDAAAINYKGFLTETLMEKYI
jgi:hypothetical protein